MYLVYVYKLMNIIKIFLVHMIPTDCQPREQGPALTIGLTNLFTNLLL